MANAPTKDSITDTGLRYKAKVAGSPFGPSTHTNNTTMSCFLCGKHRPRTDLQTRKLFGKVHQVCKPSCNKTNS